MNRAAIHSSAIPATPTRGVIVRNPWARNLLTFLMVFGPGLIVMEADNDAGAVSTYIQAGAQYGTHLLWLLVLLLPITYFIQEMVVRLGHCHRAGTRRHDLQPIRQMVGTVFAARSAIAELPDAGHRVRRHCSRPAAPEHFAARWAFRLQLALSRCWCSPEAIADGNELSCSFAFSILRGSRSHSTRIPRPVRFVRNTFVPSIPAGGLTASLVFLVVGIVGTTIAPWQLFFQQSCIADKRLRFADLKWARLDTLIGAAFTIIVAGCMMMTGNAALRHGFSFTDPAQMAADLGKVFGPWFRTGIFLLMINAAALGTTAISLSSAWAYGEVKGWPHSLQKIDQRRSGLLRRLCPVCGCGGWPGADPEGSAAAHHPERPGAGGHHAALRDHLSCSCY